MPPDNKVHGANMGPIWGRQGPGGTHVGPMNFAILAMEPNVSLSTDNNLKLIFERQILD